jgi:2-polyprenyl-3-methyl-5-hydroxy-6-metoxy-1,4-benzoquinol methylase
MRNFFERFERLLGKNKTPQSSPLQPVVAEAMPAPAIRINPFDIGLKDAARDGWYCEAKGEVYPGFPVDAEDVVVDVGCGDGGCSLFCANRGAHVIAVDIDAAKIAATTERLATTPARLVQGLVSDANPILLNDGTATKVISMEVIEHVDDPAQFLSELVRIGKPGAQYLLAVPDPSSEQMQVGVAAASYFQKPNHVRIIQRGEFEKLVTDAGLIIESHTYYSFYWSLWMLFFWICEVDLWTPEHPLLDSWTRTWSALLDSPHGEQVRKSLNLVMPKSQVIVARKP